MKKILYLTVLFLLSLTTFSGAATVYVRTDGGTGSQCTGTTDAPYPGSGTGQACAYNHPNWAIPASNGVYADESTTYQINGGDTLVIHGPEAGDGVYMMNCQAVTNGASCNESNDFNYTVNFTAAYESGGIVVPNGALGSETKIIGCSASGCGAGTKPELWGNGGANRLFLLSGREYIIWQDLEITDHYDHLTARCASTEQRATPEWPAIPCMKSAFTGSGGGWNNLTFKGLDIHGMDSRGFLLGGGGPSHNVGTITIEDTNIDGNLSSGWDMDTCGNNGSCGITGDMVFNRVNMRWNGCIEAYPVVWGADGENGVVGRLPAVTGCRNADSTPNGYGDMLATSDTGGDWYFEDVNFSHNTSDAIDLLYAGRIDRYNYGSSSIIVKRGLFEGNVGNAIKGPTSLLEDSIIIANCEYFKVSSGGYGAPGVTACRAGGTPIAITIYNSNQLKVYNNTVITHGDIAIQASGTKSGGVCNIDVKNNIWHGAVQYGQDLSAQWWTNFNAGETESCTSGTISHDYNICYNFKNYRCSEANEDITDPLLEGPLYLGGASYSYSGVGYYTGEQYYLSVGLQAASPAIGNTTQSITADSLDYNQYDRGVSWDAGALEYESVPPEGICGDSVIDVGEVCDLANLGGEDCTTQGYASGTLACEVDCLSFDYSSCVALTSTFVINASGGFEMGF